MALAKLGSKKHLDEILKELTEPSLKQGGRQPDSTDVWWIRAKAFEKLAYVRDKSTVRIIASVLYDTTTVVYAQADVGLDPPSRMAADTLSQMKLPDAPDIRSLRYPSNEEIIKAWQKWWEQNKDKYP